MKANDTTWFDQGQQFLISTMLCLTSFEQCVVSSRLTIGRFLIMTSIFYASLLFVVTMCMLVCCLEQQLET